MGNYFLGHMDYIYFIYGLSFILLGVVSYFLSKDVRQRLPWIWLALFGCTHGVHEWLDLLAPVWQEALWIRACRWGSLAASFLFLAEFGRLGLVRQRGRGPGRWILGILALLGCLGALSDWNSLGATTRYALGLVSGLAAGLALISEGRQDSPGRTWLSAAGATFILYALATGLVVPPAAFFPASALNFQTFTNLTGLPVALPRAFLAVAIIVMSLAYLRATWPEDFPESRRHRTNFLYGTGAALLVILAAGWILTQSLGNSAQEQIQKDTISRGKLIIQRLTFELEAAEAAARTMSGSPSLGPAFWSQSPQTLAQANAVLDRYQMRFNASPAYLMDPTGNTIAASNRDTPGSFVGHNFGIRPYFQQAMKGLPGRYFALGLLSKQQGFFAAFPVYNPVGKIAGVAVIKNTLTLFQQGLMESHPAFLIDPDGVIFLSSNPSLTSQSLWPVRPFEAIEKSQFGTDQAKPVFARVLTGGDEVKIEGKTYLFYRQYINALAAPGWSLVLLAPDNLLVFYRLLGIAATFILVVFTLLAAGSNLFIREGANRIVASEARFRAMFAAAPEAVFVFDTNTRKILDANPFMAQWLGYSPAELLNLKIDQLIAPESLNEEGHWQCSVGLKPTSCHRYRQKDGSLVDVECTAAKLLYGDQVRDLVFVRDITERKRAEEAQRESESHYRSLFDKTLIAYAPKKSYN
ncbi:MAG: PAS domain S-box protein [Deltaproteobacteria bacterium]|nr:PAS domain S-box protein [Deltaproteobacteria bacterium]